MKEINQPHFKFRNAELFWRKIQFNEQKNQRGDQRKKMEKTKERKEVNAGLFIVDWEE